MSVRLVSFHGVGIYGYLQLDIRFNNDLTFLTGINGSGKTTALRLIHALLQPSFRDIESISFSSLRIEVSVETLAIRQISATARKGVIILTVSGIEEALELPRFDVASVVDRPHPDERIEEHYGILQERFSTHPVTLFLQSIDTPIYLPLERRQRVIPDNSRLVLERELRAFRTEAGKAQRTSLPPSLLEMQFLAQDSFRRIRSRLDKLTDQLRADLVLAAFEYEPVVDITTLLAAPSRRQSVGGSESELTRSRQQVEAALENAGIPRTKFEPRVREFFSNLGRSLKRPSSQNKDFEGIEWLINRPLLDRVQKMLRLVEDYQKRVDALWSPTKNFLQLVNRFLQDSDKELSFDSVGWLTVKIAQSAPRSIEALSSGERQILVILGHLVVNEAVNRAGVFVVDEPELSLHLRWQELFVESIVQASPSTQFVLATHSPSIVLDRTDKCVTLSGS